MNADRLAAGQAKGLLIIANVRDLIYTPDMLMQLVAVILRAGCSSINGVSYSSANRLVSVPGVPVHVPFWINGVAPDREPPSGDLRRQFYAAWGQRHSELLGQPIPEIDLGGDPAKVTQIQFIDVVDGTYRLY